ncbi:hypothetical protein QVD17_17928 [Tagetes erecta]|uniref:Reverse transcriptase domain-containing protein n=1 Tax=Tagetes erecta TaxID=13708 RepID=A0AAD8NVN0_TARER|nr:hypothetical protein QVD17_17928 [Tagetes erecta]
MDKGVIVEAVTAIQLDGPADVFLAEKFKYIKSAVKNWVKNTKVKEGENLNKTMADLLEMEGILEVRPLNEEEEWIRVECLKDLADLEGRKTKDLFQKSRANWATHGDENSNYFHRTLKYKATLNKIHGPEINGRWCSIPNRFLDNTMEIMGFPRKWRSWIFGIVSSGRSSVLVNGSPTFEFNYQRGIRQGDPISPFLFIVAMESFTVMLNNSVANGLFKGFKAPNGGPCISHLLFADDALTVGEWSVENVAVVARFLRCFFMLSGLKINLNKSVLYGIGTTDHEVENMAGILSCKSGKIPFYYLGLIVGANMNKVSSWQVVMDIFDKRLADWKARTLSIGGRLTLMKSVLETLPSYYFS